MFVAFGFLVVCAVYFMVSVDTSPLRVFDFGDVNIEGDDIAFCTLPAPATRVQFLIRGIKNPQQLYNFMGGIASLTQGGAQVNKVSVLLYPSPPGGAAPNEYTYTFPVGSIQSLSNYVLFIQYESPVRFLSLFANAS